MHKENILGGVHSHATFLHVLMHVASDRLSVKLAVLVSVSHMCLPLPLRNGTTFNISQEDEIGADEEDNSTTPILNFTLSFEISSVSTILNISTEIADSTLPSTLQYPPDDERSIPYLPYNQYAWLRYFGTKVRFISLV
ncbi:hypothetical protein Y032_0140g2153 [Ancylostoma ceylanicum]|nr:hypothetical protein Y032_0140g2153 [Ancylostoma ceylanicum]